ncbi:uncharacterized protein LOC133848257 [Drosophila sulfurigaster albostrigata]|uniref:uncharacterized protein LOC133848257 n=1 Tax=Drosophila sulfurigaster albostrigata TaxID=89887 RepID=UPI002D21BC6A|nr:uncharacterized protein LOC133848257 [Drosophila sulfurigaster albostrigata]
MEAISSVAMSTRSRGSFVKLALLALLIMFAFLLLLNSLHNTDLDLRQLEQQELQQSRREFELRQRESLNQNRILKALERSLPPVSKATPPPNQTVEEPVDEDMVEQLEYELPEVDYSFWYHHAKPQNYSLGKNCSFYPDPLDLQLHNTYWQTFNNANVTFRMFAAYLDLRKGVKGRGIVRVLATANQIDVKFPPTQCQLWYENHTRPIIVNVTEYMSTWYKSWGSRNNYNYPHLLSCPVPDALPPQLGRSIPRTVSLSSSSCESATNSLRIHYENSANLTARPGTTNETSSRPFSFGVCLKGFDFPYADLSERIIEWFELHRLMGATKIYAYMYDVHPAVQRVLDYYQRTGYLEMQQLTMANGMPRLRHYHHLFIHRRMLAKRLNELIAYNDCFYRNMYKHDFMVNVDIDEVIMPQGAMRTWQDILDNDIPITKMKCPNGHNSYCFINGYFTKVVPEVRNHEQLETDELYVLQHTMRFRNYSRPGYATKCFHDTRYSEALHNHFALRSMKGGCGARTLPTELAQMHHYREPDNKYNIDTDVIEDRNAWKYAPELRSAVEHVWLHLDDVLLLSSFTEEQRMLEDPDTDVQDPEQQQQTTKDKI